MNSFEKEIKQYGHKARVILRVISYLIVLCAGILIGLTIPR